MIRPDKMSVYQAVLMLIVSRITIAYTYLPVISTPPANQDTWLVVLFGSLLNLLICFPILFLGNRFKGMSIIQYSEVLVGKLMSKVLGLLLIGFYLFENLLFLVLNTGFLGAAVMPETPLWATMISVLVVCVYSAYRGLVTQGRLSEIYVPFILGSIIVFTILNLEHIDLKVFKPILVSSQPSQVLFGSWVSASLFYQIVTLSIIAPDIEGKKSLNKTFFYTLGIFTVFYEIIVISTISVLGVKQAQHSNFPYLTAIQQISLFEFIERIEAVNLIGWFVGVFINMSLQFYIVSVLFSHVFSIKTGNQRVIIPSAGIILLTALFTPIYKGAIFTQILSYKILPYIHFTFMFVIPFILLTVYFIRRKSLEKEQKNSC